MAYMSQLSEADLRQAAPRNVIEAVYSAVKRPEDNQHLVFDRDCMEIIHKCFTSSTLTVRLAGVHQLAVSLLHLRNQPKLVSIATS